MSPTPRAPQPIRPIRSRFCAPSTRDDDNAVAAVAAPTVFRKSDDPAADSCLASLLNRAWGPTPTLRTLGLALDRHGAGLATLAASRACPCYRAL